MGIRSILTQGSAIKTMEISVLKQPEVDLSNLQIKTTISKMFPQFDIKTIEVICMGLFHCGVVSVIMSDGKIKICPGIEVDSNYEYQDNEFLICVIHSKDIDEELEFINNSFDNKLDYDGLTYIPNKAWYEK